MPKLKKIDLLPVLVILLFAVWYAVPSSLFLKPISWKLEGDEIRFVRETPYGDVFAKWSSEITLTNRDGFECHGSGSTFFQSEPSNLVRYQIGAWAAPCINQGPPFTIRIAWQVVLFDLIPLRRTEVVLFVESVFQGRPAAPAICQ